MVATVTLEPPMSEIRCPNCNAVLSPAALVGTWCDKCGKRIHAFDRSAPSCEAGPQPPTDPTKIRRVVLFSVLAMAAAGVVLYLIFATNVTIYVDNGSEEPVAVFLDGARKLTVDSGQVDSFSCRSGAHRFVVQCGDRTVFEETKTVESRGNAGRGKYLINPEATNRYRTRNVEYGMSVPRFQTYYDEEDRVRLLAGDLNLVPASAWIDVKPDDVLEPPPSSVQGKIYSSRTALIRAPTADADLILTTLARWDRERDEALAPGDVSAKMGKFEKQKESRKDEYRRIEEAAERIAKTPD